MEKKNLLIADDSKVNLDYLLGVLGEHYRIGVALNGESALKLARKNQPDLILLDILMPGMDGFDVCSALKEDSDTRDIPVLFISAMDDPDTRTRIFESGAEDYIPKPFIPGEVLKRVSVYLK
ncbi:MAG: response regulator [Spirochaetales bacterium]|nr:response regulator [Spirochaetales bacterium]